jgi:hypothetical protein
MNIKAIIISQNIRCFVEICALAAATAGGGGDLSIDPPSLLVCNSRKIAYIHVLSS